MTDRTRGILPTLFGNEDGAWGQDVTSGSAPVWALLFLTLNHYGFELNVGCRLTLATCVVAQTYQIDFFRKILNWATSDGEALLLLNGEYHVFNGICGIQGLHILGI